jgi:SAM-dependent methyltransferase
LEEPTKERAYEGGELSLAKLYHEYAYLYDELEAPYRNWEVEGQWLYEIIRNYKTSNNKKVNSVIDIACGTASHIIELAKRGVEVIGVDSSREMLQVAKRKANSQNLNNNIVLLNSDFRCVNFSNKKEFDVALAMYWTLGVLLQDEEVLQTLYNVRSLLTPKGLFVFDVENAEGIKREFLSRLYMDRFIEVKEGKVFRFNQSILEKKRFLDWTAVYLFQLNSGIDIDIDHIKLRFFHLSELKKLLAKSGFEILKVFGGPHKPFRRNSNSIYVISKKK